MTRQNAAGLPAGLPARFTDPEAGFTRLCEFLEIANRSEQQGIVNDERVKRAVQPLRTAVRGLPTAKRIRTLLSAFYKLPNERRVLWQHTLKAPAISVGSSRHPVPSFEYQALKGYDSEFLDRNVDEARLDKALLDFPGVSDLPGGTPEWQQPALAIWPDLRRDLIEWDTLDSHRRDVIVLALFAIATILDDSRFLHWAADRVESLADEFKLAHVADAGESEKGAMTSEESIVGETEPGSAEPDSAEPARELSRADVSDVIQRWTQTCAEVADCASRLGADPPQPERIQDLREHVRVLEQLRDPVVALLEANRPEHLVETVADIVSNLADDCDAPWLRDAVDQIHAQWKLTYMAVNGIDTEQLHADVERVRCELKNVVSKWRTLENQKNSLDEAVVQIKKNLGGVLDPMGRISAEDREVDLKEQNVAAAKDSRKARRRIFRVVAPQGQEFDPGRDYRRKWEETCAPEDPLPPSALRDPAESSEDESKMKVEDAPAVTDKVRPGVAGQDGTSDGSEVVDIERATGVPDEVGTDPTLSDEKQSVDEVRAPGPVVAPTVAEGAQDAVQAGNDSEPGSQDAAAVEALWGAVEAGRLGIAYHIARLLAEQMCTESALPPADLIAASALAAHVQSGDGEVVNVLRSLLERIDPAKLSRDDWRDQDALNLLLFSAALRPALLAPSTGAASLLRRISTSEVLAPAYELATEVADHADRLQGIRLDASLINATLSGTWQDEFEAFVARVGDWRNRAGSKRNLYHRADRVWHELLSGDGCLAKLVALVSKNDGAVRIQVEEIRKQIGDRKAFYELVQKTDRSGRMSDSIQGRALKQLWNDAQPAVDLSREWIRMMDVKPDQKGFVDRRIEELRRDLVRRGNHAKAAIENAAAEETRVAFTAAVKYARKTVDALLQIFAGEASRLDGANQQPEVIRSHDLLYVTKLDVDTEFRPSGGHDAAGVLGLLLDTGAHAKTLRDAFDARLARGDLTGAQLASERIDMDSDSDAEECRALIRREVDGLRSTLGKKLVAVEECLERDFCRGQIGRDERDDTATRLVSLRSRLVRSGVSTRSSLEDVNALDGARTELGDICEAIEMSSAERIEQVRLRFETVLSSNPEGDGRSIVGRVIEAGDILTANELMDRVEKGETIAPPPTTDDPFQDFMSTIGAIDHAIEAPNHPTRAAVVHAASARERIAGVSFEELSEEEAAHAATLLEAWHTLSTKRRVDKPALEELLQRLGFRVRKIVTDPSGRGWPRADLETEPIQDRAVCPSRQFGSEAGGRYRVLLNWEQPADESISRLVGIEAGVPTMVLHFGRLGPGREKLRKLAISTHRLFLVVDYSLLLFLAARPSGRLAGLFRCTVPFTSAVPYATTSGVVPPELFYGREYERRNIIDRFGACFIYGGRQLGKTALLRRVEHDFNRSSTAHVAKWIDLRVNEIGYARGPRDIWPLLQRDLVRLGVVSRRSELDPENRRQVDSFLNQVRKWLDEQKDRRLLLLLDEADAFLERDAKTDFSESARLKGLMDETERRFKVVIAGLHNVLRTTRQTNHPLAHFGDPIRVGAMLSNGEWRQAQALVREPLQAVGCRFTRDDLSTRILAQTNYYPSLIQIYGAELVRRLRDSTKTFPYEIGDEDIDAAYGSPELRSAMRERFFLTLQLDQRYEVIAYALVFELDQGADLGRGLERGEIADAAKAWWPAGFEMTDVEFNMLLHEMEGLGVLRSTEPGRYTLRNPNILLLLGSRDDVENALNKQRELPTVFEPASFRARYRDDQPSSTRRGPLTYQQESGLRTGGVAVVSGCKAAGLDDVGEFLSQQIGRELFRKLRPVTDLVDFERELKQLQPVRNMVTVCLVPMDTNWNTSWLRAAKLILKKSAQGRSMWRRIVFLAPPERLWRVLTDLGEDDSCDVDWLEAGPWDLKFLPRWLEDINFTADVEHVRLLMDASGGWPTVLERFSKKKTGRAWGTRIDELKRELLKTDMFSMRRDLGVDSEDVERMLRMLSRADDPFDHDSIELVSSDLNLASAEVLQRVKWSERLGLVSSAGDGCWTLNLLLKRLLAAGPV